jgi:F-type H+-transporting ATPase subunit delta
LYRLCVRGGVLDGDRVRLVAAQLASSGRRASLPILTEFRRLVRLDVEQHTARVESATALSDSLRRGIESDLARRYGPGVAASFAEVPALIGGLRIRVGSDVYDGSLRARLAALAARV